MLYNLLGVIDVILYISAAGKAILASTYTGHPVYIFIH
jgi:hypothetical protein